MLAAGVHTYVAERDDAAVDARVGYGLRAAYSRRSEVTVRWARRAPGRSRGWTATGGRPRDTPSM